MPVRSPQTFQMPAGFQMPARGMDNSQMLKGLWDRREEWENFSNPPMRLTSQDRQGVLELFVRSMELARSPKGKNNPMKDSSGKRGMFVHLRGMRQDPRFPMGLGTYPVFYGKKGDCVPFQLHLVSSDYVWGGERMLYDFGTVTSDQVENADDKAIRFTCVNNIVPRLTDVLRSVNSWEEQMRGHGFYICPTGLQSILPVGEGVLINNWGETGEIILSYVWPTGTGSRHVGSDLKTLLAKVIQMDVPNTLEFYMGLPQNIKGMLAGL